MNAVDEWCSPIEASGSSVLGMRARFPSLLGSAALIFTLAACSTTVPPAAVSAVDTGSWTVMTFSIADTNLEPFMMTDLEELGDVGTQEGLNVVALVDRSAEYSEEAVLGLDPWSGAKYLEINQNEAVVLEEMGDINTGDPNVLADFIARAIFDYPADHYALIISDHGASWPGVGADGSFDDDVLSLAELDAALAAGLTAANLDTLDLLGFDACLMATYEVASTLQDRAQRLVASQELEPGHGWDYRAIDTIADDGTATVDELGSAIIDGFEAQAQDEGTESDITLSMIDLTKMGAVDDALAAFTDVLVERASAVGPTVGRTLASTLGFGQSPDPDQDTHMADLASLTSEIGVQLLFAAPAADNVTRAINDAVVDRVAGQATQGATGMSIYFPPTVEYFNSDYRDLPNLGGWMDFLTAYYAEGADIADEPEIDDANITFGDDGVTISGTFDITTGNNLSSAYIRYGIVESDGSITFLGEQDATLFEEGTGSAGGTYDLTYLELTDGIDTVYGYLSLFGNTGDDEVVSAEIPLLYYAPDGSETGDLVLSMTLDPSTGDILNLTYYVYDPDAGTYGEFTPEPGWIIKPIVLNVLEDGTEQWVVTSDTGLFADPAGLRYDLVSLPSELSLFLELIVVDFGGNTASVSGTVTVP